MELQEQVTSVCDIGRCVETGREEQGTTTPPFLENFESRTNYVSKLQHSRVMNKEFSSEY
jgi:hypothetical protein